MFKPKSMTMGLALALTAMPLLAKAQAPLLKDEFEEKSAWTALGPNAKAEVATATGKAKSGKGALEFKYTIATKAPEKPATGAAPTLPIGAIVRQTTVGQLANFQSIRFSVKTEIETPLVISLTEKDGGRYISMIWVPKGDWQEVSLSPDDFWLSDDANDPKDPDNKLDGDKIESVAILDVYSMLAMSFAATAESAGIPQSSFHLGERSLLIDDFTVAATPASKRDPLVVDAMTADPLSWILIGDASLKLDKASPLKMPALRMDYKQGDNGYVVLVRNARKWKANPPDALVVDLACAKSCKLVFELEEKNGSKYNFTLAVPGDSEPYHRVIDFAEFSPSAGQKDDNDQLDPGQLKTLTVTDVIGAFGIAKQKNTLWIGAIKIQPYVKKTS